MRSEEFLKASTSSKTEGTREAGLSSSEIIPTEEIWMDIPGYEGQYQASSYGRIRSLDRTLMYKPSRRRKAFTISKTGQLLKPISNKRTQYQSVFLSGKRIDIHRLVTAAFYGPCPQGHEVLHRNGNRQDNRIENLAYGTHSENVRDTYRYGGKQQKLAAEDVEAIRFGLSTGLSMKELAGMYQISISNVSRIKAGTRYAWLKPEMLQVPCPT